MSFQPGSVFEPLMLRWQNMPQRDQRALSVLLVSGLLLVLWFVIINPTLRWQASTSAELRAAQETYQELVERAPSALTDNGVAQAPAAGGSLNTEVRSQANRFGVTIQSFEPDGEQIRVRVDNVRFSNLMRWLGALQARGVVTSQLTLEATDIAGQVSVQASFSR